MSGLRLCLVAVAVSVAASLAAGAPQAHATTPEIPCDYECKWPVGTYRVPERVKAGEEFEISWSYTWDSRSPMAVAAEAMGAPDGYYAVLGGAADVPPPGYAGSAVTLRLPQELEVVGWEKAGFVREMLWVDYYDRAMYEYTRVNAYAPSGRHDASITVRLDGDGMFYPITELVVDLGLSVADSPPTVLFAVGGGGEAALREGRPDSSGASGAADEHPHRQSLKWPPPKIESATMPTGAVGAVGDDETYVYGYLQYTDRVGTSVAAPSVRACAYDGATPLLGAGGSGICTSTGDDGFYGIVFPRDPDGDGTETDIAVRFTTESDIATVRINTADNAEPYMYDYDVEEGGRLASTLQAGRITVPLSINFYDGLRVYAAILKAHEAFVDMFGYDAPYVEVHNVVGGRGGVYLYETVTIESGVETRTAVAENVAIHEYGHHIMSSTTGFPILEGCQTHRYGFASNPSCAWIEGWAHFVVALVEDSPIVVYVEPHRHDLDSSLPHFENSYLGGMAETGQSVEGRVAGILWDIHDGDAFPEPHDDISGETQLLWDVFLDDPELGEVAPAESISDYEDDWGDEGYPSLGGVFRQNGVYFGAASLELATMRALDAFGAAKSGDSGTRARVGETVRVRVATGADITPSIQFYDGASLPMRRVGAAGVWIGDHVVTGSSREGLASFAVTAGGDTIATLHDVDPASRISVDKTAPSAPSAAFTAASTVELEFAEPVAVTGRAAFGADPPGDGAHPSVRASVSDDRRTVELTLDPPASADGEWDITISGSVTDLAGNAYAAGSVTTEFRADTDPPTFTAARIGNRAIEVTFNEDVRQIGSRLSQVSLTSSSDPQRSINAGWFSVNWYDDRMVLDFREDVFAGTLTFHLPDDRMPYVGDAMGNGLARDATAAVAADIVPTFMPKSTSLGTDEDHYVLVQVNPNLEGVTRISDWRVNGERPLGFGTVYPSSETLSVGGSFFIRLFVDGSTCRDGRITVEYIRPDGAGTLVAPGSQKALDSDTRTADCRRLFPVEARFVDERTVSLTLDRPPPGSVDHFAVVGLGSVVGHNEPGSSTVTLHTREAAGVNTEYEVTNGRLIFNSALRFGGPFSAVATYMDQTAPTITRADVHGDHVSLRVSEPLDAATLAGKVFTSSTLGEMRPHYQTGERTIRLVPAGTIANEPHTISVPAGITDTAGVALAQQSVMPSTIPRFGVSGHAFTGDRTITFTANPPMSDEALRNITVRPSLGSISVVQSGATVEITTQMRPMHDTTYEITINVFEDRSGRILNRFLVVGNAKYIDSVAPTATKARFVSSQAIEISLSEPLDPKTVSGAAFSVSPSLGALVTEYDEGSQAVVLRTSSEARQGTRYTVAVPGTVTDYAGLAVSPKTLQAALSDGTLLRSAYFAGPSTVVIEASGPLDASTLSGIEVAGLGLAVASYDAAAQAVTVATAVSAADGIPYRVSVPDSVLDASGNAVGPVELRATYDPAGAMPTALSASSSVRGHVSIVMDRAVKPAGGSPGALDADLWRVEPAGGTAMPATLAVAVGETVWLEHAGAPAGVALEVVYTPGGGDGDVVDAATRRGLLGPVRLVVEDRIPPTFTAATASQTATVVAFDRAVSGSTGSAEWTVGGTMVAGVSALGAGEQVPTSGLPTVTLPQGTTRIALHHARVAHGTTPEVAYSPANPGVTGIGTPQARVAAGSAVADDRAAPSVVAAAFAGPQTLHVELDERPGAGATADGAFTVAGPGGSVGVASASVAPHSATVTLTLSANAEVGKHTVTAGNMVTDAAGNAVAAGARAATASWAVAAGGAPSFEARTASLTSTMVTFMPAVSGSTSAASWTVSGTVAAGIARVGEAAVANPMDSVPLPDGTASITLTHAPLHGTAAEPIVRHSGTGILAGEVALGDVAAKASDGVGPLVVSAINGPPMNRAEVHVRFSEPVRFVDGDAAARDGLWEVVSIFGARFVENDVSVHPKAGDKTSLVVRRPVTGGEPELYVSYRGAPGVAGAVADMGNNWVERFEEIRVEDTEVPEASLVVRDSSNMSAGFSPDMVTFLPGTVPVAVISSTDGDRLGFFRSHVLGRTSANVVVVPPLTAGQQYMINMPPYADDAGNIDNDMHVGFTFGSDSAPPTVESARFAGPREVRVTFSEPLRAVPGDAAFSVTASGGSAIPLAAGGVSHAAGLRTVTLSLSKDASPGAHEVRVPATVTDLAGNAYVAPGAPVTATYDAVAPTAVSAAFTGERAVTLTVSEALDAATVGLIRVQGLGATSASYTAGTTEVALHTQLAAAAGSSHAVVIPAGVTDAAGVPLAPTTLWAARADTAAPAVIGARTISATATEVDFGEAVRLGASPTARQHAAHWTVTEGGEARAVIGAEVVRGGLSVRLTHAPVGASAMPSVSYAAGTNDDASVRDWAATPNYLASTSMAVAAGDGLPPSIDSLTMSVARPGEAGAPGRVWARAGDMVRFAMSMSEAAGTDAPVIRVAGAARDMMASGEGRRAWTHSHVVPATGAEQGALAFVVSASDGGGNFAHAEVPTSGATAMVDTVLPSFKARTLGAGLVEVTLSEPVRGAITASEWTVGGAAAAGVSLAAASGPGATVALDPGTRFVLWHAVGGTGETPEVRYSPPARA